MAATTSAPRAWARNRRPASSTPTARCTPSATSTSPAARCSRRRARPTRPSPSWPSRCGWPIASRRSCNPGAPRPRKCSHETAGRSQAEGRRARHGGAAMNILVLGASGYVGSRLLAMLRETAWAQPIGASSRARGEGQLRLDTRDGAALAEALRGMDAVVNCVAGDAASIGLGARMLAQAAAAANCPRVIHLSTMSVYGDREGCTDETSQPGPLLGWYDQAKRDAEQALKGYASQGGTVAVLRPG